MICLIPFYVLWMRVSSAQSAQSGSFCRMRFTRVRFLFVRQTPLAAPRTRALRTDWTSSVSHSLQTGGQHAEESKDEENHILGSFDRSAC